MARRFISFTCEGYENLRQEIKSLENERKTALENLQKYRDMGDLSENSAYRAAKSKLGSIDRRLRFLVFQIKSAQVVEKRSDGHIGIGSRVKIRDPGGNVRDFTIVDSFESDVLRGKISTRSPLGSSLIGKKKGEAATVVSPSGLKNYVVVKVD